MDAYDDFQLKNNKFEGKNQCGIGWIGYQRILIHFVKQVPTIRKLNFQWENFCFAEKSIFWILLYPCPKITIKKSYGYSRAVPRHGRGPNRRFFADSTTYLNIRGGEMLLTGP